MDWSLIAASSSADASWLSLVLAKAWQIGSVGAGLGFVIFVHELGHFLVAKACGVKCEKFYVGFDFIEFKLGPITIPRALWKRQWGETEYGIGILPLGGYVKMLGQDDDPRNAEAEAERCRLEAAGAPAADIEAAAMPAKVALDPRSYPAKSVPQRMAIISAGVIMNLIFGVLIGATAYWLGVNEIPTIIGATSPGDPAWVAGLAPGDKIVQIGKDGTPSEDLRFGDDLTKKIMFHGVKKPLPLLVRRANGGAEEWLEIQPSARLKKAKGHGRPSLGVAPSASLNLASSKYSEIFPEFGPQITSEGKSFALKAGDAVTHLQGKVVKEGQEVQAWLVQHPQEPVKLTISRVEDTEENKKLPKDKQIRKSYEIEVAPRLERLTGIQIQTSGITGVRKGSPAEKAGFEVKDQIQTVDGEPLGDPLTLSQRMLASVGKDVKFVVLRKGADGKEASVDITVQPTLPDFAFPHGSGHGSAIGVEPVGIALGVTQRVAGVEAGSPAAGQVLPGDDVIGFQIVPADENQKKQLVDLGLDDKNVKKLDMQELDENAKNWTVAVYDYQQVVPAKGTLELTLVRQGVKKKVSLLPVESKDFYDTSRGLDFMPIIRNHQAQSVGEALSLGAREVKERMIEVLTILSRLITGDIAATNLSGPLGILGAAGSSASNGISTLLMFLTLLSANLAVMNFMPIPALDGGHMLFLLAEWVRGKPVDEQLQIKLTIGGVLCLLSLMVFATLMDVSRFFM